LPGNCKETAADCSEFATNLPGNLRRERRRAAFLKKRLTPCARDLFQGLVRQIGRDRVDITIEAHCLKVAELMAACEALRAKTTEEPTPALVNSVTRLESTAARAGRALAKLAPPKSEADAFAEAWERAQRGDDE
jgi:hypothetical protein